MPDRSALLLAQSRIKMSLWGLDSHGVECLPHDLDFLSRGLTHTERGIAIESMSASTARVDGGQGHGIIVAHDANQLAITLAFVTGLGAVGVKSPLDCGAMTLYTRHVALGNLLGIAISRTDGVATEDDTESPSSTASTMVSIALPRDDGSLVHLGVDGSTLLLDRAEAVSREISADSRWTWRREVRQLVAVLLTPMQSQPLLREVLALADLLVDGPLFLVIDPSRLEGGRLVLADLERTVASLERRLGSAKTHMEQESQEEIVRRLIGIPIASAVEQQINAWSESLGVAVPFTDPDCCPPVVQ